MIVETDDVSTFPQLSASLIFFTRPPLSNIRAIGSHLISLSPPLQPEVAHLQITSSQTRISLQRQLLIIPRV